MEVLPVRYTEVGRCDTFLRKPICLVSNSQRHTASTLAGTQNPQYPDSNRDQRVCLLLGLGNSL